MEINEKSPPGFGGTTSAMKKHHPELGNNIFALAWSMKNKGYKSHYVNDPKGTKSKKEPKKKKKYKTFHEFLETRSSH